MKDDNLQIIFNIIADLSNRSMLSKKDEERRMYYDFFKKTLSILPEQIRLCINILPPPYEIDGDFFYDLYLSSKDEILEELKTHNIGDQYKLIYGKVM